MQVQQPLMRQNYDDPNAVMPTTGANNGLKLADLTGVAYDDPEVGAASR